MSFNKNVAVIDLGSNTFHLLICSLKKDGFDVILKKRIFVALAEYGIHTLSTAAITRANEAILEFKSILDKYSIQNLTIIGTAALRSATNANPLIEYIEKMMQTPVSIINGKQEAIFIYKGVQLLDFPTKGYNIIMDIGGGSTEFILMKDGKFVISESCKIGVGVLHNMFNTSDPIEDWELEKLHSYVKKELHSFDNEIQHLSVNNLIGASGSFEVLANLMGQKLHKKEVVSLSIESFRKVYTNIIGLSYHERLAHPLIPQNRAKLISIGMILMDFAINLVNPQSLVISPYALKEGVIADMSCD